MKKTYTNILSTAIVSAIIIALLCYLSMEFYNFKWNATDQIIDSVANMSESPGSGELALIGIPLAIFVDLSTVIALGFILILLPWSILIIEILLQGISCLVQIGKEKKAKDITSKILTITAICLKSLLCLILILGILLLYKSILSIILLIVALTIGIISIVKTINLLKHKKSQV